MSVHSEKLAIDSSIDRAQAKLKFADYEESLSPEARMRLAETRKQLEAALGEPEGDSKFDVPTLRPPPSHPDPAINASIQGAYATLTAERLTYLAGVRGRLQTDPRLSELVETRLAEIGCEACWHALGEV
jgi:hypothetical protein